MSWSERMETTASSLILSIPLKPSLEKRERLVEVEGRMDRPQIQVELHHRDRYIRLDPHNYRLSATESRTRSRRSFRRETTCESDRSDTTDAIRYSPCREINTDKVLPLLDSGRVVFARSVTHHALSFLQPTLEVSDGLDRAQVDIEVDECLSDPRGKSGHYDAGTHESGCFDRLEEMVRDRQVDRGDARYVDHDNLRTVLLDRAEELFGELARPLRVEDADDGKDEQPLAHLQDGS